MQTLEVKVDTILTDVNAIVTELQGMRQEMATKQELQGIRQETKQELQGMRQETKRQAMRQEMATKQELQAMRQDVADLQHDLQLDLNDFREEVAQQLRSLRMETASKLDLAELRQHIASFRHENHLQHAELFCPLREEMYGRFQQRSTER